jgi:phenylalanyl-tRNA synthetase beta chain
MCAITDKSGILGLGGIIGGTRSGTELSTRNILLESAYFYPSSIRKTANILNIDTDAKYRFERGIDPSSSPIRSRIRNVYDFRYVWW